MFDSLKCVKRLEEVGISREQAEVQIQIMGELIDSNLVTGQQFTEGINTLRTELKGDMTLLRDELKGDMAALRDEVKGDITTLRNEFKEDMTMLRDELKGDVTTSRNESKADFAGVRLDIQNVRHEIRELEARMTIKLGTIISVSMGLLLAVIKLT